MAQSETSSDSWRPAITECVVAPVNEVIDLLGARYAVGEIHDAILLPSQLSLSFDFDA